MLGIEGISARYGGGALALSDVSLRVAKGGIVALLGLNGAGKTTTLRVASGVMRPSSGHVDFDGQRIDGRSPAAIVRRGVAHSPEGRHVFPDMSVRENLELGAYTVRDRAVRRNRLESTLEVFPRLHDRLRQRAGTLSGGEQQMLAIGRALMSDPKLLLLDEPMLGLSPAMSRVVAETVTRIREAGMSILLVEQNMELALSVADWVYFLEAGRVVGDSDAARVRAQEGRSVYMSARS
ncbi:MAG: ATP-binding cassette domain-containing protein [Streptosporangiales bacterium]|nr:ATP-binding cassette domain-containing protein [Streptosporangiales bacterium]